MFTSFFAVLLPLLVNTQTLGVCAACRQALESSGQVGLEKGLAWSVVLLLGAPAFMVTVFITVVVRATRKHQAAVAAKAAAEKPAAAAESIPAPPAATALETPRGY